MRAKWPIPLSKLADRIGDNAYSDQTNDGFLLNRVRSSFVDGQYVERLVSEETVTDPFGKTMTYQLTRFRSFQFILRSAYPQIEIVNPARGVKSLLLALSKILDARVAFEIPKVNPLVWAEELEKHEFERFQVESLEIADLVIGPRISAKLGLLGSEDVRRAFRDLVPRGRYAVSKCSFTTQNAGHITRVSLAADGSFRTSEGADTELTDLIRGCLPE